MSILNQTSTPVETMYTTMTVGGASEFFINHTEATANMTPEITDLSDNRTDPVLKKVGAPVVRLTDLDEYNAAVRMYDIYTFLLFIPGTIGNFLALAVILRRNMRGMSSAVFVAALAIFDNISLLGFMLGMLSFVYVPHVFSNGFCMAYYYLLSTGSMISAWTVVAMSFERVLIVTFPLQAPNWTTRTKAFIGELCIMTFCMLHNSHYFWTSLAIPPCSYDFEKYGTFLGIYSIYDACMTSYVPLVLIFLLNAIIIIQMTRARAMQKKMSNTPSTRQDAKGINTTNQITVMLLAVSVTFFLSMLPFGIFQILSTYVWQPEDMTIFFYAKLALTNQVSTMLWMVNHSLNVVLYSLTGRKFRNEMLSMFTCGRYSASRSQSSKYASRSTELRSTNGAVTSVTTLSTIATDK